MSSRTSRRALLSATVLVQAAIAPFLLSSGALAQSNQTALERAGASALEGVYESLRTGRVATLVDVLADRVDLTIFGSSEVLSKSQAKYVLQDFFRNYPPTSLTVHETSPSEGNWFASAAYGYRGVDEPLTVYLRMRVRDAYRWELRELRFGRSFSR